MGSEGSWFEREGRLDSNDDWGEEPEYDGSILWMDEKGFSLDVEDVSELM